MKQRKLHYSIIISVLFHLSLFSVFNPAQNENRLLNYKIKIAPGFESYQVDVVELDIIENDRDEKKEELSDDAEYFEKLKKIARGVNVQNGAQSELDNGINNLKPEYPEIAKKWNWEGTVYYRLKVLKNGKVAGVEISKSSGYQVFDDAVIKTLKLWTFPKNKINFYIESKVEFKSE